MPLTAEASPDELWRRCYVAATENEAYSQAARQFDDFAGATIVVSRITGKLTDSDAWDEIDLAEPAAVVITGTWDNEGWDGDTLYPDWKIRAVDPTATVRDTAGREFRLADVIDLGFTAPGIGTRDGFAHRDAGVLIEPTP